MASEEQGIPQPELKFSFAEGRFQFVLDMVRKKANAALGHAPPGKVHFLVYPPQEYLERPDVIREPGVFDNFKDTVWWVRWYDDQYDQVSFGEFLAFIENVLSAQKAFERAVSKSQMAATLPIHRQSKHAGGWTAKKDRSRKPNRHIIQVEDAFDVRELITDQNIRRLFDAVVIEKTVRPTQAMN